jgi:hypothetical protein
LLFGGAARRDNFRRARIEARMCGGSFHVAGNNRLPE